MALIKSLNELEKIRDSVQQEIKVRKEEAEEGIKLQQYPLHILVCSGTACQSQESKEIIERLKEVLKEKGYEDKVQVVKTGCFGFCEKGPIIKVYPDHVFYVEVKPEDAKEIVTEHIIKGKVVERLLYEDPALEEKITEQEKIPFYKNQLRLALRNCGFIDPENIGEYIAQGGYLALGKAVEDMTQEEVIEVVKESGLRGRGGGGFPTGYKWELTYQNESDLKFIICNADEGDPGAFMDRSILEGDPHSILEAMTIAGYAIGAEKGYIYIRAEYPLAIQRLNTAIEQARQYGFLGEKIFGSDFNFDIELKYGAGAFVCGEETALLNSIEGGRGEPNAKPPFPAESGLWNKPTCINNVETLANIPEILLKGSEWFNGIGTKDSKGTKVFALAGKVNNVGLVEVPMGMTLREIIYDIGGGIRDQKRFKAVQTGGPSGGCIPEDYLDTPIDYQTLQEVGSMMGSGGMIIMDEDDCMVNIAKFYIEFTEDESCGKCTPCRIGNKRLFEILTRICMGKGTECDLENLKELAEVIQEGSLCGLGQSAPNPVLSTLRYFEEEYKEHVQNKKCPAGVCTMGQKKKASMAKKEEGV